MHSVIRGFTVLLASLALVAIGGPAYAQKDKPPKEHKEQKEQRGGPKEDKEKKPKKAKHQNGKNLVGDKVKKNGKHKFHVNGKHSAFVNVADGKIRGINVTHAEKGDVPVKKYKTRQKMAQASTGGMQPVSMVPVQLEHMGTTWIGYAYIDDWGDEVIYWFPYDMIYDGDTGAVEYVPAY
jgi:hypothetical protein